MLRRVAAVVLYLVCQAGHIVNCRDGCHSCHLELGCLIKVRPTKVRQSYTAIETEWIQIPSHARFPVVRQCSASKLSASACDMLSLQGHMKKFEV